ncbi:hypothetical protein AWU65_07165 [Paenibacillus glucanolyticus]|uniref:Uncharacterized protein n=1 Tax=Paenibacillus glucanolyticus TaxID=59843 RepID=A0A163HY82_9BACL|nr:hypothetical protein [Paenibacillus glucanolyticus]KZS45708.1 hypothetical protein AWU65_07165 [Paenibacillus glucanolyticus]
MAKKNENTVADQVQTELTVEEGNRGPAPTPETQPAQNPSVASGDGSPPTAKQKKTIRAVFLTNCTHNRDRYQAEQKVNLPEDVFNELLQAKAIRPLGE